MSALKIIQRRTHDLIAAVTPSFLHLLPDLPCDYDDRPCFGGLPALCRSLLRARQAILRRSCLRWSRIVSSIATRRLRVAFSCWAFQSQKPRLPFSSSLCVGDILQPSCRSSVLAAATSLIFSLRLSAPSICSKWTRCIFCFVRLCILRHICERMLGWYALLSTRRLTGHWRMIASQLALFRTLGRWREQQKLRRYFRNWRVLCSQESKVRLHRCYFDSFSCDYKLRLCLAHWHLHACKVSSAKKVLLQFVRLFVLRRALLVWHQLGHVQSFASRRFRHNELKLKRLVFYRLQRIRTSGIRFTQLAEQMRASVQVTSKARLLRTVFTKLYHNSALSRESIEFRNDDDYVAARHFLSKFFKRWAILSKDNRLQACQQVTSWNIFRPHLIMIANFCRTASSPNIHSPSANA